jgi:hypothetical protein
MTHHCASCKTEDMFRSEYVCQGCYRRVYEEKESLKATVELLLKRQHLDQETIKQVRLENAQLRQPPLFPAEDT